MTWYEDMEARRQAAINGEVSKAAQLGSGLGQASTAAIANGQNASTGALNYTGTGPTQGVLADVRTINTGAAAEQAAAAAAAAEAAKAGRLRGEITSLANSVKDIFNSRYGQVDAAGTEQTGKLQERFGIESKDITDQVAAESQNIGAAHAATGSYDSSYRGNNVDTVTREGEGQVRDLGSELAENLNKVAQWINSQKAGFEANKQGIDQIISRLAEESDVNNLSQIRNTLEGRIADLRASGADNNTAAQNKSTLEAIAPSSARAQQLKTTLSSIIAGNADKGQKSSIAQRLITSAGVSDEEAKQLLTAFQADLDSKDETVQPVQA